MSSGGEIVHLLKELLVVLVVAEVVVGGRILVVVGERYAGYYQPHGIVGHILAFQHVVVVDGAPQLAGFLLAAGEHPAHHLLFGLKPEQPVFAHYPRHLLHHLAVLLPLLHEALVYLALALGINQIEVDGMSLHESVYAGYGLKLVVKTVVDEHYRLVAVVLEIQALAEHLRLGCKVFQPSVLEVLNDSVGLVVVLRAVDCLASGNGFAQFDTLRLEVVPKEEMVILVLGPVDYLHHSCNFLIHVVAPFAGGVLQSESRFAEHLHLPVAVCACGGIVDGHHLFVHPQFGQLVTRIRITEVGRTGEEQRPRADPQPELFFLVGIEREVVGLGAVALEESGQGLSRIHHAEITRIVYQLLVPVGRRSGGGHKAVGHAGEKRKKLLISLGAESAQHAGLVERCHGEICRLNPYAVLTVANAFVIGYHDVGRAGFDFLHGADVSHLQPQMPLCLLEKLNNHTFRANNQALPALVFQDDAYYLQLGDGLLHTEAGKYGPASAPYGPTDGIFHMRIEGWGDFFGADVKPGIMADGHLCFQKFLIFIHRSKFIFCC